MGAQQGTTRATPPAPAIEKLYMENTLLRVAGALFCHDAKLAATRTNEIALNPGVAEKAIVVRPDPRLGQPGPLAHKLFVALIKKHSDYGRPVQREVSFTRRELMRLAGRKTWGGRDSEELARALREIHYAFVRTSFKQRDGRFIEHSFNIFPEVYLERAERETDPIEKCVVTLARPIIASLEDDHFTCLNHVLMRELGTIGQALYMRLFFHFANLYDGHHRSRLMFQKRYADICVEWLGGLKVRPYRSKIETDQLGGHLRSLVKANFLASYKIAKAANGDGFVIAFRPGAGFFADYDRFYRHRAQGDLQFTFNEDRVAVAEPIKLAHLFREKRFGRSPGGTPWVSSKEVATARHILTQISFDDAASFIDHALTEAKKTRFDVQSLGGLRQYVESFLAERQKRAAHEAASHKRDAAERDEADQRAYGQFIRASADELFATLPAAERATIEKQARAKLPRGSRPGPLADLLLGIARANLVAERYQQRLPSYDEWRKRRAA
jgi:hypothetical protein